MPTITLNCLQKKKTDLSEINEVVGDSFDTIDTTVFKENNKDPKLILYSLVFCW